MWCAASQTERGISPGSAFAKKETTADVQIGQAIYADGEYAGTVAEVNLKFWGKRARGKDGYQSVRISGKTVAVGRCFIDFYIYWCGSRCEWRHKFDDRVYTIGHEADAAGVTRCQSSSPSGSTGRRAIP